MSNTEKNAKSTSIGSNDQASIRQQTREAVQEQSPREIEMTTQPLRTQPLSELAQNTEFRHDMEQWWEFERSESPEATQAVEDFVNNPKQGIIKPGSEKSPGADLGLYGLTNANRVTTFMLTPAGETVKEEIAVQEAIKQELKDELLREQREHQLLMQRIRMALLLWYIERRAHASKKVNELILDQIAKADERLKSSAKAAEHLGSPEAKFVADLQAIIQDYEDAIKKAKDEAKALDEHGLLLQNEHEHLLALGLELDEKHNVYQASIEQLEAMNLHDEEGVINEDAFTQAFKQFNQNMAEIQKEIDRLIEQELDPRKELQKLNALNLQFASMHDMRAIHEGRKYALKTTVNGEEAHFVINSDDTLMALGEDGQLTALDKKNKDTVHLGKSKLYFQPQGHTLVKDGDKVYLLKPGQDLKAVKENDELSAEAEKAAEESFDKVKQGILSVKHVIGFHKGLEKEAHNRRVQASTDAIRANNEDKKIVANNVRLLQAGQADARDALRQMTLTLKPGLGGQQLQMTAPTPTPKPTLNQGSLSSSQVPSVRFTQLFKMLILEGQQNRSLLRHGNTPQAPQPSNQTLDARLKNGASPLSALELIQLEKRMHGLGKDLPVASTRRHNLGQSGPNSLQRIADTNVEPNVEKPSPLKTTPSIKPY